MGSVLESSYIRRRLQEMDQMYPEPNTFGSCDCTSYSYFALSAVMVSVGTYITVLALGDIRGYLFSSLGHMWLVGPIFICSGVMIAGKSILYLRRKSLIQMFLRQRVILGGLHQLAQQAISQSEGSRTGGRNASTLTLPPAYESLLEITNDSGGGGGSNQEAPPPSYDEAMFLIGDEKIRVTLEDETKKIPSRENSQHLMPLKDTNLEGGTSNIP